MPTARLPHEHLRSVLSNPLVAAGHSLTEASNVSRGLPTGAGVTKTIATGLPLLKSADVLRRAAGVDLTAPENTARLHRLALSGALRIGDERGQGWVDAAHSALFGPNGVDTRMRLVASKDAEAAWTKAGGSLKDPAFTAFERDYVTGHSGNYVGKNQGTAIQALNQSGLTPFIAIGRAKLGGSLQAITGGGGPAGEGLGQRLLRVQRGPVGQAAAITGAGYLLSGHAPTKNAPGHETDLATGVYHVADGSYHYFRGDPDEAVQTLGQGAKEVYLRKGFFHQIPYRDQREIIQLQALCNLVYDSLFRYRADDDAVVYDWDLRDFFRLHSFCSVLNRYVGSYNCDALGLVGQLLDRMTNGRPLPDPEPDVDQAYQSREDDWNEANDGFDKAI